MDSFSAIKNINTENDLRNHLKGTEEDVYRDFNSYLPIKKSTTIDSNELDFFCVCKLVGAFSNTLGGIIYIGVKEKNGVFTDIIGVEIDNWERLQKDIHQKLRSVYDPIIEDVVITRIQIASDKYVNVILCPMSDDLHQLSVEGLPGAFLKRVGPNVVYMTSAEVKAAVLRKDKVNKITSYRKDRIEQLITESSEFVVKEPSLIIHVFPDQSNISLKVGEWKFKQNFRFLLNSLIGKAGDIINSTDCLCAEGIRFYTDSTRHLLIKKTGDIELICDMESHEESVINFGEWAKHSLALISHLIAQLAIETKCQSWRLGMTLVGVKGKKLMRGDGTFRFTSYRSLPKDRYYLDFIKLGAFSNSNDLLLQINERYHSMLESIWHDVNETMPEVSVSVQYV